MTVQTAQAVLPSQAPAFAPAAMPLARAATIDDVPAIVALVDEWAAMGLTISRTPADVAACLDEFVVAEFGGSIVACGALREVGESLGEIRSIAVASRAKGIGAGRAVVELLALHGATRGIGRLVLLSKTPGFFERVGFTPIAEGDLPDWYNDASLAAQGRTLEGRTAMERLVPHAVGVIESTIRLG